MPEKNDDVHDDHDEKNEKVGDHAEDGADHGYHNKGGDDCKDDSMKTTARMRKTKLMKSPMIATAFSWEWKGACKS